MLRLPPKVGMDWRSGSLAREDGGPPAGRGMREVEERSAGLPRALPGGCALPMVGSGDCARGGKASPAMLLRQDMVGLMSSSYTLLVPGAQYWEQMLPACGVGATCMAGAGARRAGVTMIQVCRSRDACA